MDNIEKDDLNPVGTEMQRADWDAPYQEVDEKRRASPREPDETREEPEDDWHEGRPKEEPWNFSNGLERTSVYGMNGHVLKRQKVDILKCSSGPENMGVHGMNGHTHLPLKMAI